MAREIGIQPHYIRGNEGSRVPRRWIYLDTEAGEELRGGQRVQTWRLGITAYERSDGPGDQWTETEWREHETPTELWAYIDAKTRAKSRTIVMAHNLGYDLRISQALIELPALGWHVDQMAMSGRSLTMTFKREGRSLVLCDSTSWWPMSLEKVGRLVGVEKVNLPRFTDSDEAWRERCRVDVEILRKANRDTLEWIEGSDMGNWQRTGAGMAWANWRHSHYTHRVLVHADQDARDAEVAAIATARVEAWRWGKIPEGTYTEWDLPLAYPRIAAEVRVPVQLQGHVTSPSLAWLAGLPSWRRALVHATVSTHEPVLPYKADDRWLWPVGTFTSWWWDTELIAAAEAGAVVETHEAITYRSAMALKSWADWAIDVVTSEGDEYTDLQRATVKHWSRALIGRFGAKYPIWIDYGQSPEPGLELNTCYDTETDTVGKALTMGERLYLGLEESYVADACPAILGVVMAECRVRLWELTRVAGPDHVLYMDTDSLITDEVGTRRLRKYTKAGGGYGLRPKRRHHSMEILGPRQVILEGSTKMAGVPNTAQRTGPRQWRGQVWQGVEQALREGNAASVVIRESVWNVTPTDRRRSHLEYGRTAPFSVFEDGTVPETPRAPSVRPEAHETAIPHKGG